MQHTHIPNLHTTFATSWCGEPLELHKPISLELRVHEAMLHVHINAPFFDNPHPNLPKGSTPKLWEHEVVECFILGKDDHYLEMEFGPHGHYLLLQLCGERQLVRQGMRCEYDAHIRDDLRMWTGDARIPMDYLPPLPSHYNAYAIHTLDGVRCYMAKFPNLEDVKPDFHRLTTFGLLPHQ